MTAIKAPEVVVGTLKAGYPAELDSRQEFPMTLAAGLPGLWEIPVQMPTFKRQTNPLDWVLDRVHLELCNNLADDSAGRSQTA